MSRGGTWLALGATLAGCTHTYVYSGDRPPRFERGEVVVEVAGRAPEHLTVQDVAVEPRGGALRAPSTAELRAWGAGEPTPDLDRVAVAVSTQGKVWRDWVLPGFGAGAGLVLLTVGGLGLVRPDGTGDLTLPLTIVLALALGLEGALIGGSIGALAEEGTTDLRIQDAAPAPP